MALYCYLANILFTSIPRHSHFDNCAVCNSALANSLLYYGMLGLDCERHQGSQYMRFRVRIIDLPSTAIRFQHHRSRGSEKQNIGIFKESLTMRETGYMQESSNNYIFCSKWPYGVLKRANKGGLKPVAYQHMQIRLKPRLHWPGCKTKPIRSGIQGKLSWTSRWRNF
jgi:hypothetical protein